MAQDTFAALWNRVLLFAPDLPPYIAQEFVKQTHQRIVDYHLWSELKQDAEFTVPTWYTTGTVEWTEGGTTVTGTGTLWDTGTNVSLYQQIQLGNIGNYFTIVTITDDTHIEVDRAINYASSDSESYHIGQLYIEFPTDLDALEQVRDKPNEWKVITHSYNQEYLDRIDPNRTSSGTPTLLAYASNRIDASGNQIPRMELWPPPSASHDYVYRYRKHSALSAATDRGVEIIPNDAYLWGALAEAALWPGTSDKPNVFFSTETHQKYEKKFSESLHDAWMRDIDRDQRMITSGQMGEERFAPIDAKYWQSHGL
jgi:hypothetical protein